MRDLDRIREVREYKVSGPQLTTFLLSGLLLVGAVFIVGYQVGRLRAPADAELLEPLGAAEQRDPGAVLAEMMARRADEAALSAAAAPVPRITASDDTAPSPGLRASDVAALPDSAEVAPDPADPTPADPAPADPTPADPTAADPTPADMATSAPAPAEEPVPDLAEVSAGEDPPAVAVVERPDPVTPAAAPELAPLPAAPAGRGYTVQVGAYATRAEAADTVAALQVHGLPVFHVEAVVNGQTWHRVRVGLHATREGAEASAQLLADSTPFPPYVTAQP